MLSPQEIEKLKSAGLTGSPAVSSSRPSLAERTKVVAPVVPKEDSRMIKIGKTPIVGGVIGGIAKDLYKRAEGLISDTQKAGESAQNLPPVEKALGAVSYGAKKGIETIAGGVGDIFTNMISPFIPQKVKDVYGEETATAIADIKKAADESPMVKNLITSLATKAKDNPEIAGVLGDTLSDVLNITALGAGKTAESVAKPLIKEGLGAIETGTKATVGAGAEMTSQIIPKTKELLSTAKERAMGITPLVGEDKVFSDALKIAREKVTPAYEERAAQEGRTFVEGRTKKVDFKPTRREELLTDAIKPLLEEGRIKADALPFENIPEISQEVSRINQGVKQMIQENKIPFNSKQLRSKLEAVKADSSIVFASDPTLERTYDALINAFIKETSKLDTAGLFEARQSFDKIPAVKKLLDGMKGAQGENLRRQAVLDIRRAANEYVADQLPINSPFRDALKRETYMLEVIGNLAEKSKGLAGSTNVSRFMDNNPIIKKLTSQAIPFGIGVGAF